MSNDKDKGKDKVNDELEKVWLITGITGQDGSWMAEYLLNMGYKNVHGIIRRAANFNTQHIDHMFDKLTLHYGDLTDCMNMYQIIANVHPDYIVNFAAQSHVKISHTLQDYTVQVNTLGVLYILQSVRDLGLAHTCKVYHASTSEMYGNKTDGTILLNEDSPMEPVSIYGISKLAAQQICNMFRDAYNMFVVSSVLFNHEGPRRGPTFVTQKVCDYVAKYSIQMQKNDVTHHIEPLLLGNLNARRDWGDARDYVQAIFKMLQNDVPKNYVIATGKTHSVREFVELAFREIGIYIEWKGTGIQEAGYSKDCEQPLIKVDPKYYRDIDIECLIGDATRAKNELKWTPETDFETLVTSMVHASIQKNLSRNCK